MHNTYSSVEIGANLTKGVESVDKCINVQEKRRKVYIKSKDDERRESDAAIGWLRLENRARET